MRTGSREQGEDAKATRARGNTATCFADAPSCNSFRWFGAVVCVGFVLFFEKQKAVGLIVMPLWMAASVP